MSHEEIAAAALDQLAIELPSWGFANTGTRFGKFLQAAAATHDRREARRRRRRCTSSPAAARRGGARAVGFPGGVGDVARGRRRSSAQHGVRIGAINPNLFQDQLYKHGSLGNPDPAVRAEALAHLLESVDIARELGSARSARLWFADGTNYPGQEDIRKRKQWFAEALGSGARAARARRRRMLVEYKPFEPAFYHTDIADWGMALVLAHEAGPQAQGARRHRPSLPGRRTSSRSSRGCSTRTCSADSTSTTASTPTTISRSGQHRSVRRSSASSTRFASPRDARARRAEHRLHGRSDPQPQAQDRGDDPDRDDGPGAVRQGVPRRSRGARRSPGGLRPGRRPSGA